VIVVYAGRRPSDEGFPDARRDEVAARIRRLLAGMQPRMIVGSAAAGADLLTLKEGVAVGATAQIVLAGTRDEFRESSVADVGGDWGQLFDRILDHPESSVMSTDRVIGDDEATYGAATEKIWTLGKSLLEENEGLVVLVVARPRDAGVHDHSEDLVIRQQLDGGVVLRIDPVTAEEEMPRAFVAMPFGTRPWPERRLKRYKADLTYHRILLPVLLGAGFDPMRADTQAMLEVIDSKMLAAIARADLVVADLATENPNVMWELGVRHAWKPSGTILIAPEGMRPPFDVARVPVTSYRRGATRVSDADCIEAIRSLQRVLDDFQRGDPDSPVFLHLPTLNEVAIASLPEDDAEDSASDFLDRISLATDLHRDHQLREMAREIEASETLRDSSRAPLLEQIALSLIDLDCHGAAAKILRPLAEADTQYLASRLQEQFAHSLIRDPAEAGRDERMAEAEIRLGRLSKNQEQSSEVLGLLGSAAKARVEIAVAAGADPLPHLKVALRAYEQGMEVDPGDYYPGINAVALRRIRGQHLRPDVGDLERVDELLPVVRFAVLRAGPVAVEDDLWAMLTLGEVDLHRLLLHGGDEEEARKWYEKAAGQAQPYQLRSARRQLELFRDVGDPVAVIKPFLDVLGGGS
jgi:hypothetical protein